MEAVIKMAKKLRELDVEKILDDILQDLMPQILELNKGQLIDGITSKGEMIRPKYTEDPYFKSRGQALAYAGWKAKQENEGIIPKSSSKHYTAPNLYINGYYHSLIKGAVMDVYIEIDADGFGSNFDNKYKDIYGLTEEHLQLIRNEVLPRLQKEIRLKLAE